LAYKTLARSINLTDVVFTSSVIQMAEENALKKMADLSRRRIMNIFSLSNIEIQIQICKTPT
jgi:hypothetical protein